MKKTIALLLSALLLSGCAAEQAGAVSTETVVQMEPAETAAIETFAVPGEKTEVYAEFAIERFLAQRPDATVFTVDEGEYTNKVVLTFSTPITAFRVLELTCTADADGKIRCESFKELYALDSRTENDITVIQTGLDGLLPTRGISFVDNQGSTRFFYLALSGEDNVPLAVEF